MRARPVGWTHHARLIAMAGVLFLATLRAGAQPIPAGRSAAVLSFIDASAGWVEVVRHWPQAPADVDVYPFLPYWWGGCPGPGAVMMLVTDAGSGPLAEQVARGLEAALRRLGPPRQVASIARIATALRTPGDPAVEALKSAAPLIGDLYTYERLGYAVFLFIHWTGTGCGLTLRAVPEGYGIPFVD